MNVDFPRSEGLGSHSPSDETDLTAVVAKKLVEGEASLNREGDDSFDFEALGAEGMRITF